MNEYDIGKEFARLVSPLEDDREAASRAAFKPESRPIPAGLIVHGPPLGHIAFMGDFDSSPTTDKSTDKSVS